MLGVLSDSNTDAQLNPSQPKAAIASFHIEIYRTSQLPAGLCTIDITDQLIAHHLRR